MQFIAVPGTPPPTPSTFHGNAVILSEAKELAFAIVFAFPLLPSCLVAFFNPTNQLPPYVSSNSKFGSDNCRIISVTKRAASAPSAIR
jgi:hypothetical protein